MRELYDDPSKPPANTQIWLGGCVAGSGYSYPVSLSTKPKDAHLSEAKEAYGATFSVGHVAFQIFGHRLAGTGGKRRFADGTMLARGFSAIWPFEGAVNFPGSHIWTLAQLEKIGRESWGPDLAGAKSF